MEENKDLNMSLFDSEDELEINMDLGPIDEEQEIKAEEADETLIDKETAETDENKLDEDESSEEVVEDEGQEEGEKIADDDNSPNIYSSFASVLNEQGLLPSLDLQTDEKIETIDDLTAALKVEIANQGKDYILDKIGQDGYDALEKGINLAEYQQYQDNVTTLDNITEDTLSEDLELSKKIIYQDYVSQGISEARATRLLNKSVEAGDDSVIEDAVESLGSLKVVEAKRIEDLAVTRQEEVKANQVAQEKIDNDLKNSIYNKKEFIEGIKTNKTIQDKVYTSITKIVGKSPTGVLENQLMKDRRENPTEFDSKLYYLYEMTKGFKDFSTFTKKSETSAINKLERELRRTKFKDSGTPSYLTDPDSYDGFGSELVI